MRAVGAVWSLAVLLAVGGCGPESQSPLPAAVEVQAVDEGLVLRMSVPQREYVRGQAVPVTMVAENTTAEDMAIEADSGALVSVSLWRQTAIGWQHVKTFPTAAVMLPTQWVLPAGKARTFAMDVPVTADWPTAENLRLMGHLNGRPAAAPAGLIQVWATAAGRDRENDY